MAKLIVTREGHKSLPRTWDIQFRVEAEVAPRRLPREAAQLRVAEAGRQRHRLPVLRRRRGYRRVRIVVALMGQGDSL